MKRIASLFITACILLIWPAFPSAAQPDLSKLRLPHKKVGSYQELIRSADVIVFGRFGTRTASYPTGVPIGSGQLVNYVQPLRVLQTLKGPAQPSVSVLTDGVEPLPKPSDPLNLTYTGPLAEGEYLCFLQKVPGTNLYSLIGPWQGLYPVRDGKLISLQEGGFQHFMGLTVPNVKKVVDDVAAQRTGVN
ncbi:MULTISPECIES: hypothetical protein [unclassified Paenibacillus]|uniref:hypothetical protein n=1 Tax=unclassified Paenibacillus TaxID=185978 RepID=UPI0006D1938F|nr:MULTISPECIES: hypothetical protein [unclassified Paenibacillus]